MVGVYHCLIMVLEHLTTTLVHIWQLKRICTLSITLVTLGVKTIAACLLK